MRRTQRLVHAVQPAILCFSMLLAMLGSSLILLALLALWMRAPEQVSLHRLTESATIVRGGEQIGMVLQYMRGEVLSAIVLCLTGILGMVMSRSSDSVSSCPI